MSLSDLVRKGVDCLKAVVFKVAPPGTAQWHLLRRCYALVRYGRWRVTTGLLCRVPPLDDPFDRTALNEFLRPFDLQFPPAPPTPVSAKSATWSLLELLTAPDLRDRFPHALREGQDGPLGRWLITSEARDKGVPAEAVPLLLEALGRRPAFRAQQVFELEFFPSAVFPLGLTPVGRPSFLYWLLRVHQKLKLEPADALAFFFDRASDPALGLADTYRRLPLWQRKVPHGLTRFGWDELRSWVARYYRTDSDWLAGAVRPDDLRPSEELLLLWRARADLQSRFADAETDLMPLARYLRERGDISAEWWPAVVADLSPVRPGVNVLAHFRYPSGLQVAARNTAEALTGAGWAVSLRDVPSGIQTDRPGRDDYLGLHPYPVTIAHLAPDPLAEDCYPRAGLDLRKGTYRIGYWYWELEQVPARWKRHRSWLHELWAPTRFIADALRRALPLPVHDMLAGMRMPPEVHMPRSVLGLPDGRYLFLFVFDMASTAQRKNPLAVVQAFRRAFPPGDTRAALAIKVSRGKADPAALEELRTACGEAGATLIDAFLPEDHLFGLMNACDAYVSLHRSEGYGLTMAEAMALGKPVIATGYSGNLDFMTADNSLLVDYRMAPLKATQHLYRRGCLAAEPSVEQAAEHMRRLVERPEWGRTLGARASTDVRRALSMEAAGRRMAARLEAIIAARQVRRAA